MKLFTLILVLVFGILVPISVNNNIPGVKFSVQQISNIAKPNTVEKAEKYKVKVAGWYPNWDKGRAMKSYSKNVKSFEEVSPYWYKLNNDGSLQRIDSDAKLTKLSKKHNVRIIPMISNSFDGKKVSKIIRDPRLRKAHINNIVHEVEANHYDGIELDYEGLIPTDRHAFSVFVKELSRELHRRNKIISVTLMSKTSEPGSNSTAKAQDWKILGHYADRMRIMAYDYHWKTSGAGPIAPYPWVRQIVRLAVTEIPRNKIVLGVGTYGYRWGGGRAQAVDYQNVPRSSFKRDAASKELHSKDGLTWLQDSGSLKSKVKLAKDYRLRGIALWRLGGEDPHTWDVIRAARQ